MERYDIAIVGGGLVGPALALALAPLGLRLAVIDADPPEVKAEADYDPRAYAVALGSQRLLEAVGIWPSVADAAEPVRAITVGEGVGPAPLLHFDPAELDEGRMAWILPDTALRRALLAALPRAAAHLAPLRVEQAAFDGPRARLSLDDGRTVEAGLVVAADGRRSRLAAAAGIGRIGWRYGQSGLVNRIAHERPHGGVAHQSFFPGGPFAVLPLRGNRCALVWSERTGRAEALAALPEAAFARELQSRIGDRLGPITVEGPRRAYPLDLTLAERYVAPRLALAGDAAHGVHPIAGQGFNMGLRDVAALAEVLADAARRGEDIGTEPVLRRYQTWRRFDAASFALGTDAINRLFSNRVPGLPAFRMLGLRAVDGAAPLRRAFMREAAGLAGDLPRLLRGEAV